MGEEDLRAKLQYSVHVGGRRETRREGTRQGAVARKAPVTVTYTKLKKKNH